MSASLKFLDDDREPTDFEIAQLISELRSSSTALVDVTGMVDHIRRQNYTAGVEASTSTSTSHVVKLPARPSMFAPPPVQATLAKRSLGSFSVNVDLLNEILKQK